MACYGVRRFRIAVTTARGIPRTGTQYSRHICRIRKDDGVQRKGERPCLKGADIGFEFDFCAAKMIGKESAKSETFRQGSYSRRVRDTQW